MLPDSAKKFFAIFLLFIVVIIAIWANSLLRKSTKTNEVIDAPITEVTAPASTIKVIGNSVEGRSIEAYSFGNGEQHLVFVGGIHGGYEWNSVLLAYSFIDYLKTHPEIIPKNLTIDVLPSVNPDAVFKVTNQEGRFAPSDVTSDSKVLSSARFNAHDVDLNRNFDCKWQPKSTWQSKTVSAGTAPFSEPEARAIKDFMLKYHPSAVVFWHSQANGVFASTCDGEPLVETFGIMDTYSRASKYPAIKTFDAYVVTGAAEDWLASIKIPAITVELKNHNDTDWTQNLAGSIALINYFKK
jgi:predicted deacylase